MDAHADRILLPVNPAPGIHPATPLRQRDIILLRDQQLSTKAKPPQQCGRRKQVCGLRSVAEDVNSLARLESMNKVGELDLRQQGLLPDAYLSFGNGSEGGVAVEPEAVFPGWRPARRECLPGGT